MQGYLKETEPEIFQITKEGMTELARLEKKHSEEIR
jgi:hypothetical protein